MLRSIQQTSKTPDQGLKIISLSKYKDLSCAPALGLTAGEKLCPACKIALEKHKETQNKDAPGPAVASHSSSEDESSRPIETASSPEKEASVVEVNTALVSLDETPVKLHQLPSSSKRVKGKKKFVSAVCSLKKKLESTYDISLSDSNSEDGLGFATFRKDNE